MVHICKNKHNQKRYDCCLRICTRIAFLTHKKYFPKRCRGTDATVKFASPIFVVLLFAADHNCKCEKWLTWSYVYKVISSFSDFSGDRQTSMAMASQNNTIHCSRTCVAFFATSRISTLLAVSTDFDCWLQWHSWSRLVFLDYKVIHLKFWSFKFYQKKVLRIINVRLK